MDNPDTGNIGHKAENEHKQRCNQEWTIQTQATLVTKQKMNTNKAKKNTTQKAKKMSNIVRIKNRDEPRCFRMTSVSYNNVTHSQLR